MPWTQHILQSVAIPAVTQVRVSDDYQPSNSQWRIGQPDCHKYSATMSKMYPALETFVAALSGGPIGPSNQIGTANISLVMATW